MRHVPFWLGIAAAFAASAAAPAAHAEPPATSAAAAATETDAEPPDYPPPSTRWAVAGVGLAAAGAFYGMGAGMSYAYPDVPGMKDLRKPVIGPWIAVSHSDCGTDPDCSNVLLVV